MGFLNKILPKKKEKQTDIDVIHRVARDSAHIIHKGGMGILLYPHITEKSADAVSRRTYAFVIAPHANKQEVKKAIQSRYGVNVTDVRVVTIRGKEIRRGRQIGWKQGIKKAYVTLAQGQTIEIL